LRTALAQAERHQAKVILDGPRKAFTIWANDSCSSPASRTSDRYFFQERRSRPDHGRGRRNRQRGKRQAGGVEKTTSPRVIVNIQRQPGANIINVVDRNPESSAAIKSFVPSSVQVSILTDPPTTIRASRAWTDVIQF